MSIQILLSLLQVVLEPPTLIDSIDDMYRSNRMPVFIENHYATDFFKYDRGNYKVRAIWERAKTCSTCFRRSESLLGSMSMGGDSISRPNYWSFYNEEMLIDGSKKGLCVNHFRGINKIGVSSKWNRKDRDKKTQKSLQRNSLDAIWPNHFSRVAPPGRPNIAVHHQNPAGRSDKRGRTERDSSADQQGPASRVRDRPIPTGDVSGEIVILRRATARRSGVSNLSDEQ